MPFFADKTTVRRAVEKRVGLIGTIDHFDCLGHPKSPVSDLYLLLR